MGAPSPGMPITATAITRTIVPKLIHKMDRGHDDRHQVDRGHADRSDILRGHTDHGHRNHVHDSAQAHRHKMDRGHDDRHQIDRGHADRSDILRGHADRGRRFDRQGIEGGAGGVSVDVPLTNGGYSSDPYGVGCRSLRMRAEVTGSAYWLARYQDCRDGN